MTPRQHSAGQLRDLAARKRLRMLSVNLEMPTQALGEEAINLLFEKHRLNRIA
jgi:hypothetical protein